MLLSRQDVVMAVASGATVLVDPRRLSPRMRRGYRVGITALTAAGGYYVTGRPDVREDGEVLPPAGRAGIAVAVAGVVYGSVRGGERMDAAATDWLTRRGVRRPRIVLAVAGTALTLGMSALEKWEKQREAGKAAGDELVEVTPDPARDALDT